MSCIIDLIKKTDEYIATADESHKLIARNEGCWATLPLHSPVMFGVISPSLPLSVAEFCDCQDNYR